MKLIPEQVEKAEDFWDAQPILVDRRQAVVRALALYRAEALEEVSRIVRDYPSSAAAAKILKRIRALAERRKHGQ